MLSRPSARLRVWLGANPLQALAFAFCFLFGLAIVVNVELAGEATWFWYATLLHRGVKLYADTHLPLQPLYVLETDGWMRLFGRRCLPYEMLAVVHVFLLCLGMLLLLRESTWPDWRKAAIFFTAFFVDIFFVAIRFDDFHVVNDTLVLFTLLALLRLFHAVSTRRELSWAGVTGLLAGLAFMNRSTDGGTLLAAAAVCVPFLAQRRRWVSAGLFLVVMVATMAAVLLMTGDTLHAYLSSSILHAAAAKGGGGTVLRGPVLAVLYNLYALVHEKKCLWVLLILVPGAVMRRLRPNAARMVLTAELIAGSLLLVVVGASPLRRAFWNGVFINNFNVSVQTIIYPLCAWVLVRALLAKLRPDTRTWDPREVLLLVPAATLLSAAVSQATATTNSTIEMALVFLLSAIWLPIQGRFRWWTDSWIVIGLVMAVSGLVYKEHIPYGWNAYAYPPMFQDRQWYRHPVYGPMYIDTEALRFNQAICAELQQANGPGQPELLSLPYSYANYFCDTPPWHNYVQTWFDTATPDTMQTLMNELDHTPPRFILYERQLLVLHNHEKDYNGGRPVIHRKLDEQIMGKLESGEWKLLDRRNYLVGDGWFLIQTHP